MLMGDSRHCWNGRLKERAKFDLRSRVQALLQADRGAGRDAPMAEMCGHAPDESAFGRATPPHEA